MYDSYTDEARLVFQLANQNAQRFNNHFVTPEHILRGFCQNGGGVGQAVFQKFEVSLSEMTRALDQKIVRGQEILDLGRVPFSRPSMRVRELAEAEAFGAPYIGTEHVLLALLHEELEGTIAFQVMSEFGVTYKRLKSEILSSSQAPQS